MPAIQCSVGTSGVEDDLDVSHDSSIWERCAIFKNKRVVKIKDKDKDKGKVKQ